MLFGYRGNSVETDKKGERIELEKMVILNLEVLANSGNNHFLFSQILDLNQFFIFEKFRPVSILAVKLCGSECNPNVKF